MSDNKKLIKVSYIRQEREYISELYPEYKLLRQACIEMNINNRNIPVDVLTIQTNQGEKTFYFDVSDIFNNYDSLLMNNNGNAKDPRDVDFAKLLINTVLGAQTKEEKEKLPWIQKIKEHIEPKAMEGEQESKKAIDNNNKEIFTPSFLEKILVISLGVILLLTLIFLYYIDKINMI